MVKVVCCSCETAFKYELIKAMKNCPVCGELLWDEEGESNDENEECESNEEVIVLDKKGDKVRCKSCGMSYEYDLAKTLEKCRACGRPLWDEKGEKERDENQRDKKEKGENENNRNVVQEELRKSKDSKIHFNQVHYPDSEMEGFIRIQCAECFRIGYLDLNDAEIIEEKYIKIKKGVNIQCKGCNYKHGYSYLTYAQTIATAPPLPRCPVCNSPMLKKITTGSKILAAAAVGAFALPYNSKTYECKNCGYRF